MDDRRRQGKTRFRRSGEAFVVVCVLSGFPSLGFGGMLDTPLPTFSDGKAAQVVGLLPRVIKKDNLETVVACTNLDTVAANIGLEVFDKDGVLVNSIAAGNGEILNVAVGATRTIGTDATALLTEDHKMTLLPSLRNGSGRVVASKRNVFCVAMLVDELHEIVEACPSCQVPSLVSAPVWSCGNSVVDPFEECDDGNTVGGDGCDNDCQISGSIDVCPATPLVGCLPPSGSGKSQLQIKDQGANGPGPKDKIQWKWFKGPSLTQADFGDPVDPSGPDYKFCVYAGATPSVIVDMQVPAGGTCSGRPCWRAVSTSGYKYGDRGLSSSGVKKLILKAGVAGKSKILLQGKDGNLPLPTLPLASNGPVIAQLSSSDSNLPCYEETFPQANVTKNVAKQFKAKTP